MSFEALLQGLFKDLQAVLQQDEAQFQQLILDWSGWQIYCVKSAKCRKSDSLGGIRTIGKLIENESFVITAASN